MAFDTITGVLGGKTLTAEHTLKRCRITILSYFGYYSRDSCRRAEGDSTRADSTSATTHAQTGYRKGDRITAESVIELEILPKEAPFDLKI